MSTSTPSHSVLYKVKFIVKGLQYATDGYGYLIKKNDTGARIPPDRRKTVNRDEMRLDPVYSESEVYIFVRSDNCIQDIMECIPKYYSTQFLDCTVEFTDISRVFPVQFTIIDKELTPQHV